MELLTKSNSHIWKFSRVGGLNRVNLESGKDLMYLDQLDQKLWTALSCPINGLEIDSRTLSLIDTDNDTKIRVPELLTSIKWIMSVLKNPDDLLKGEKEFPLSAINEQTEEGKKLLLSAKQILINLGKPDYQTITVEEASDTIKIFEKTKFNGDGIITINSTDDIEIKNLITDISSCLTTVLDRSGVQGISKPIIEDFYKNCDEYSKWYSIAEQNMETILPFGNNTEAALNLFNSVKNKIDDYFIRCRLSDFDENSTDILNLLRPRYELITPKDLSLCLTEISTFPLAKIESKKVLSFDKNINPAWQLAINNFKNQIVIPVFGKKENINEEEWQTITLKFTEYQKWMSDKKGVVVEKLGLSKIREILKNNKIAELILLIDKDNEQTDEANYFGMVEKMVRFYRDLFLLLRNFVSFIDFYSVTEKAIFQAGTLYIDRRSCDLCIRVNDMPKHGTMGSLSGAYLLYCDCTSKSKNEKMTIVAALTDGDIDNLMVGRNALFYDRKGNDWDATIVKIVENPISIRQAFWSPYRKIAKLIEQQIEKMASAREASIQAKATEKIATTSTDMETKTAAATAAASTQTVTPETTIPPTTAPVTPAVKPPIQPFDMGKFVGIFAAVGLAIGAIGTALASIVTGFISLAWWKMPLAILGIMLIISGPSMIIAWFKLRKRNLAPLLDANGWAINAGITINIPFGKTLTQLAKLPKNSQVQMNDPYTKKKAPLLIIIPIVLIILGVTGYLLWKYGILANWGII